MSRSVETWLISIPNQSTAEKYGRYVRQFLGLVGNKAIGKITAADLESYLAIKRSWGLRHMAQAAVRHYMEYMGHPLPNRYIGIRPDPALIQEPTAEEMDRVWAFVADELDPVERAVMYLLRDTGHRRRSIAYLPRSGIKMLAEGPVIEFPSETDKRGRPSVVPVSEQTWKACMALDFPIDGFLLPILGWKIREEFISHVVEKVARGAGVKTRLYAHLFRHLVALKLARANTQEDAAVNMLGWKDGQMYRSRYGRRQPYETLDEARASMGLAAPKKRVFRPEEYLTK